MLRVSCYLYSRMAALYEVHCPYGILVSVERPRCLDSIGILGEKDVGSHFMLISERKLMLGSGPSEILYLAAVCLGGVTVYGLVTLVVP
jgi:hypothetical protein